MTLQTGSHAAPVGPPGCHRDSAAISVWIDDNHPIYRRGVAACLVADGFELAGESARLAPPPAPDVDALLFEADDGGLRRAASLVRGTATRLVAVIRRADEALLSDAVEAGIAGIVLRDQLDPRTLVGALRAATSGSTSLPDQVLPRLLDAAASGHRHTPRGLSPRELAVLKLLADGEDTRDIASALCWSERTVKNVVHDLLVKMNCRNRAHAVASATRQGVI